MDTDELKQNGGAKDASHPETGPTVSITVNGKRVEIHRGRQTVAEIKGRGGVALSDVLEQVVGGVLTPLPDDGAVTIKGGEAFVSHVRDGSSA
ncbi:MAG TPA: hypothetical protein VGM51_02440 [Armatimonadota bacterium]|jgi:hypothetical protein